ncbi:MAG: 3-deoxy-7-phosphoheptulonate synthase, partial [Polyangia bacterium]
MLIVMRPQATEAQIAAVVEKIHALGLDAHEIPGAQRMAIGITGNRGALDAEAFASLPGVADAIRVSQPFKLVSREVKEEDTVIDVGGSRLGGPGLAIMAGPCSVESEEQILEVACGVKELGATFLRGGAFKPRTSPYEFQGLGEAGLKLLALAREKTGLKVVTEIMDTDDLPLVADYADVLQLGARNMQNFSLLRRLGKLGKPVLLKRGASATIKEWLMAAEYIVSNGNYQVALCERGIRTFETMTRNTLDLNAVPVLKSLTHLPVIVDPSHGIGMRRHVPAMARAAVAAGADGLIIEVHPHPD